jgi:asparagine N-glycosylation enzyme membrane subunit Stt3
MKIDKYAAALIAVFLLVAGFRIYFAFQANEFSDPDAYFVLRQVENIDSHGTPLFHDSLSYGGRQNTFAPFYYYFLAFFGMFMPPYLVSKIIPNVLASLMVIIVYFLTLELTQNRKAAIFAAIASGFIPVFFSETLNSISIYSLTIPLIFLALYFFIKKGNHNLNYFLITFLILCITHASTFLLVAALLLYLLLCKLENLSIKKEEIEVVLFSLFFIFWSQFLIYKRAFLNHGFGLVWQNIPAELLNQTFKDFNILTAILQIGILPFVFGIYIIFKFIYGIKNKMLALLTSLALSTLFLMWLKLIEIKLGLIFLGVTLSILFGYFYGLFEDYIKNTKVASYLHIFFAAFIILFLLTSFYPAVEYALQEKDKQLDPELKQAMFWLNQNTDSNTTIMTTMQEGNLVTYFSKRKNFMDDNFLTIQDVNKRYKETDLVYTSQYESDALAILNKYKIDYLVVSTQAMERYGIEKPKYVTDERCFELVFENITKIYKVTCKLEVERFEIYQ